VCFPDGDGILARSGTVTIETEAFQRSPATFQLWLLIASTDMISKRKPAYFRNSLDLSDKVQVKVLRRRLKISNEQLASAVRKSGNSISAITKECAKS
jgi:Protein of unknown function (DUF3606)